MKTLFTKTLFLILMLAPSGLVAQNWDYITSHSDEYYFGEGHGDSVDKATSAAKAAVSGMISTRVSSSTDVSSKTTKVDDKKSRNSEFKNYVHTYTAAVLPNVVVLPPAGKAPDITVRAFIKRADVERVFAGRAEDVKGNVKWGDKYLADNKLKNALENYYNAYMLLGSLQYPDEVTDDNGFPLMTVLENKIKEMLEDIDVKYENTVREGEISLRFTYKGVPVRNLEFTYNDGNIDNAPGRVKDGLGVIRLAPGYSNSNYHVNIKHSYKEEASVDALLGEIVQIAPDVIYKENYKVVTAGSSVASSPSTSSSSSSSSTFASLNASGKAKISKAYQTASAGMQLKPVASQLAKETASNGEVLDMVLDAVRKRQYTTLDYDYFTDNGYDVFNRLIKYGSASVIGNPEVHYFKGPNGTVVARGVQMSFSFKRNGNKTFVEDVVFTFNAEGKIDNVAFGLGNQATNDLLCHDTEDFGYEAREQVMEFLENYKTAYCLERRDYIETIFSDSAVIITGHIVKVKKPAPGLENAPSVEREEVKYQQFTKRDYIKRLEGIFARNEFINIHFTDNVVQPLTKFKNEKLYAIAIGQEYTSSTYSDKGYLFLLIDMTNKDEPLIKIRTWQPNTVSPDELLGIGDFYLK